MPAGLPIVEVEGLSVRARTGGGHWLVKDLSFHLHAGETLGILGESGSGKTLSLRSLIGALPARQFEVTGSVRVLGHTVYGSGAAPESSLRQLRGQRVAMVYQDPSSALDPLFRVGAQMVEALLAHRPTTRQQARTAALDALAQVQLNDPERIYRSHPHELSGGQKQRIAIAMALLHQPNVLLADEPTTALDMTIQAQLLQTLRRLQKAHGMAIVLVSHDVSVMAEMADRVLVMHQGRLIEQGSAERVINQPQHEQLRAMLDARSSLLGRLDTASTGADGGPTQIPMKLSEPAAC